MKKYEYVTVNTDQLIGAACDKHRKIISDCAAAGWRYVGFIPTKISGHGTLLEMDLVFEKDV